MTAMIALAMLAYTGPIDAPTAQAPPTYHVGPCLVDLVEEAQVPAQVDGVLIDLHVRPGDEVSVGDPLAQIDDAEMRLRLQMAQFEAEEALIRAESDIQERYAHSAAAVADREYAIHQALDPGVITSQELERYRLKAEESNLNIQVVEMEQELAGYQHDVKNAAVQATELLIGRCQIRSPIHGVVVQTFREQGEWVQSGEPVLRVVNVQRLKIEGFVDAADLLPQQVLNRAATITVQLSQGHLETFEGTINFVSPLVQAGGLYRISCEVENRKEDGFWVLRPGLTAEMEIQLAEAP